MWGNCLTYGAVAFSALIALGWWEDVAYLLAKQVPMLLFLVDNISIWVLFLVSLLILDTATRYLSTVKVKFNVYVENIGNFFVIGSICDVLHRFTIIANLHLGMVGAHYSEPISNIPTINGSIMAVRVLSEGNLSGFTQVNSFHQTEDFLRLHLQRRQAIMLNWQGDSGSMQADEGLIGNMRRERR